jgi:F420-dependent methylenetetrahydromethanopterin dehydrogenase
MIRLTQIECGLIGHEWEFVGQVATVSCNAQLQYGCYRCGATRHIGEGIDEVFETLANAEQANL